MPEDRFARGTERFANTNFAGALAHGDEHHVHHTEAAEEQRGHTDGAHEHFHAHDNHAVGFGVFDGVPNTGGFFVARIEVMQTAERVADLLHAIGMRFQRPGCNEEPVHAVLDGRRLVGEIAAHGVEGEENLSHIRTVVTGILVLGLHDADDGVRNAIHPNRLAKSFAIREELLLCVAAEERDVTSFRIVLFVVKPAFRDGDAANFGKGWQGANGRQVATVKEAMHLDVVAELRHHVFAGRRFLGDLDIVVLGPADDAAGTSAARLHAGAPGEDDHDVLAKTFLVFLDADAKPLAGGDHHGDGDDSPGDAEHRQHGAPLVRPEGRQRVPQQILV